MTSENEAASLPANTAETSVASPLRHDPKISGGYYFSPAQALVIDPTPPNYVTLMSSCGKRDFHALAEASTPVPVPVL